MLERTPVSLFGLVTQSLECVTNHKCVTLGAVSLLLENPRGRTQTNRGEGPVKPRVARASLPFVPTDSRAKEKLLTWYKNVCGRSLLVLPTRDLQTCSQLYSQPKESWHKAKQKRQKCLGKPKQEARVLHDSDREIVWVQSSTRTRYKKQKALVDLVSFPLPLELLHHPQFPRDHSATRKKKMLDPLITAGYIRHVLTPAQAEKKGWKKFFKAFADIRNLMDYNITLRSQSV